MADFKTFTAEDPVMLFELDSVGIIFPAVVSGRDSANKRFTVTGPVFPDADYAEAFVQKHMPEVERTLVCVPFKASF